MYTRANLDLGEDAKSRSCTHNVSTGDVFQYCGRFTSSGSFAMLIAILRAYRGGQRSRTRMPWRNV